MPPKKRTIPKESETQEPTKKVATPEQLVDKEKMNDYEKLFGDYEHDLLGFYYLCSLLKAGSIGKFWWEIDVCADEKDEYGMKPISTFRYSVIYENGDFIGGVNPRLHQTDSPEDEWKSYDESLMEGFEKTLELCEIYETKGYNNVKRVCTTLLSSTAPSVCCMSADTYDFEIVEKEGTELPKDGFAEHFIEKYEDSGHISMSMGSLSDIGENKLKKSMLFEKIKEFL